MIKTILATAIARPAPLACVWIATGNSAQPLECRWVPRPRVRGSAPDASAHAAGLGIPA